MRPEIRRRTISEGAVISIPVGIVALLFLITILFFLHLYYRSRRSHLVSRKPVDLLGSETTAPSVLSTASPGSWVTNYDKELPQTPKEVHITLVRVNMPLNSLLVTYLSALGYKLIPIPGE